MVYKTHYLLIRNHDIQFNLIYERGNLQSHLVTISYYAEALLWLSNRITVKAWHPVCQLRFFRGRCKTQHNTCPLTVQYYTTIKKKNFQSWQYPIFDQHISFVFLQKPCKSSHGFIFQNKCSTFFLVAQLQPYKNKRRVTYGGKNKFS